MYVGNEPLFLSVEVGLHDNNVLKEEVGGFVRMILMTVCTIV